MSIMRCAIYARYSSDLQRERSIEDQVRNCQQHADKQGWLVLDDHLYTDHEVSGVSVINRTGLEKLKLDSEEVPKLFDLLLVDDTSRLSRKPGEVESIIERLKYFGIHVIFVSQGIDSRDKQSALTVGVNSIIDSQYRRDLATKTTRGMVGQALKGYNVGGRIYGYRYIKEEDPSGALDRKTGRVRIFGTRIEVEPEQSEIVRQIFQLYADGLSIRDITHYLNEKGYPPPFNKQQLKRKKGKPAWIPTTVRNFLSMEKYIGDWTFNKTGWIVNPDTGQRKRIIKDRSEWVDNQQPQLTIVDNSLWDKVQDRLQSSRTGPRGKRRSRSRFLFSGMMKCHECGSGYVVVSGTDRANPRFGCNTNYHRGKAACSNDFKVLKNEIETRILQDIQENLLSLPILSVIIKKVNQKLKARLLKLRRASKGMLAEREILNKQAGNIIDAISDGFISNDLKQRLMNIEHRRNEIDRELSLVIDKYDYDKLKVDEKWVEGWLGRMRELLLTDPMAVKAKLMSLVGEFTLTPEIINGIKYLRVTSRANIGGVLEVAVGRNNHHLSKYWGADLNRRPPDPQSGVLTN